MELDWLTWVMSSSCTSPWAGGYCVLIDRPGSHLCACSRSCTLEMGWGGSLPWTQCAVIRRREGEWGNKKKIMSIKLPLLAESTSCLFLEPKSSHSLFSTTIFVFSPCLSSRNTLNPHKGELFQTEPPHFSQGLPMDLGWHLPGSFSVNPSSMRGHLSWGELSF